MKKVLLTSLLALFSSVSIADCLHNEKQVIEYNENATIVPLPVNKAISSIVLSSYKNTPGKALVKVVSPERVDTLFNVRWAKNMSMQIDTGRLLISPKYEVSVISGTNRSINVTLIWCERK